MKPGDRVYHKHFGFGHISLRNITYPRGYMANSRMCPVEFETSSMDYITCKEDDLVLVEDGNQVLKKML